MTTNFFDSHRVQNITSAPFSLCHVMLVFKEVSQFEIWECKNHSLGHKAYRIVLIYSGHMLVSTYWRKYLQCCVWLVSIKITKNHQLHYIYKQHWGCTIPIVFSLVSFLIQFEYDFLMFFLSSTTSCVSLAKGLVSTIRSSF